MNRSPREEVASEDDENTIVLSVILNCELTKSSDTVQLHFKSPPISRAQEKNWRKVFNPIMCPDSPLPVNNIEGLWWASTHTLSKCNCVMVQNVIQWLREILELFQTIEENDFLRDEERDPLLSSYLRKAEDLIWSGEREMAQHWISVGVYFISGKTRGRTSTNSSFNMREG